MTRQEEIDTRQSRSINRLKCSDCHPLNLRCHRLRQWRRDDEAHAPGVRILLRVIEKTRSLIVDNILTRETRLRLLVSKKHPPDLARDQFFLDDDLSIVFSSEVDRIAQRFLIRRTRNAD